MKHHAITKELKLNSNYKLKFTSTILFIIFTSNFSLAAVARMPRLSLGSKSQSQTEGSICSNCASRSPQANSFGQLAHVTRGAEKIYKSAYFNDNGERSRLTELRNRRAQGETLTTEEKAILQAADRVGRIVWPNCKNPETGGALQGNAFLIQIDGKDAIVTSAHLMKYDNGNLIGDCDLKDFSKAVYMPNLSYLGHTGPGNISDKELKLKIAASVDQRFGDFSNRPIEFENDFSIFFLDQQISSQPAPNSVESRGFIKFAESQVDKQITNGYILGVDRRQIENKTVFTTFQKCDAVSEGFKAFNRCDTSQGSTGSFIGVFEGGELKFQGLNNRNTREDLSTDGEHTSPSDFRDWNQGISSDYIKNNIDKILNPLGKEV